MAVSTKGELLSAAVGCPEGTKPGATTPGSFHLSRFLRPMRGEGQKSTTSPKREVNCVESGAEWVDCGDEIPLPGVGMAAGTMDSNGRATGGV
jgi:hypothetical protein